MGSIIGAFAYPSIHSDSLAYRLPRILHWLAEGRWHWIHTPDDRMNVVASSTEWVWAPMMLFFDCDRILCLTNLISYAFLPGLLYALLIRLGIKKRLAWWWMWLMPASYCYALQAGSLATDGYAAVFSLGAVVFAFKAIEQKSVYYGCISMLSIGFATGTKQTILLAVPLWFLPFSRSIPILLKRPLISTVAAAVALLSSFLPNAIANVVHAGTWKGFASEGHSHFWTIIGNAFYLPLENLMPPIFPAARAWNNAMQDFVLTPIGSNFGKLDEFGFLYRGPSENFGGLGFLTCVLLATGLLSFRRPQMVETASAGDRYLRLTLLALPWLLLPVFLAAITFSRSARYLAFYYPFLLTGILYLTSQPFRSRWWRCAAYLSMATALVTLALLRQRPLFPVSWTTALVERFVSKDLAEKTRNSFGFAAGARENLKAFHDALPPDTQVAGYIARVGTLETALWHPYGSRRVWRFGALDGPELIRNKGVEYVILTNDALNASESKTLENWLQRYNGEVIFTRSIAPEPDAPPEQTYLIRLRPSTG